MSRVLIPDAVIPTGPFTRAKVAGYTGLPDDVLSHWTKEGLLVSVNDATGTGRHKEFDQLELHKAAVLKNMREFGCSIEVLRWFASTVDRAREIAAVSVCYPLHRLWYLGLIRERYDSFSAGKTVNVWRDVDGERASVPARNLEDIIIFHIEPGGGLPIDPAEIADAKMLVEKYHSKLDLQAMQIAPSLTPRMILDRRVDGIFLIWPTPDGWELYQDSDGNMSGLAEPPLAGIMLYVTRILRGLWSIGGTV